MKTVANVAQFELRGNKKPAQNFIRTGSHCCNYFKKFSAACIFILQAAPDVLIFFRWQSFRDNFLQ